MNYDFNIFSAVLLISALISLFIARYSWRLRFQRTGLYLCLLTLATGEWALAAVFEAAATSIYLKTLWSQISYLGIVATPVFYLLFSWSYSHRDDLISPKSVSILSILPLVTIIIAFTNGFHHALWTKVGILEADNIGLYDHGVWFYVNMVYSYFLILMGVIAIIRSTQRTSHLFSDQQRIIILGAIIPLIANMIYVFGLNPIASLDWTPISFGLSGLLFAIGIFYFGMLNVVPIARNFLVETMEDGMMVLDLEDYAIDVNPSMAALLDKRDADIIGKNISTILSDWDKLLAILTSNDECDVLLPVNDTGQPVRVKVTSIVMPGSKLYGRLLTCHGTTRPLSE